MLLVLQCVLACIVATVCRLWCQLLYYNDNHNLPELSCCQGHRLYIQLVAVSSQADQPILSVREPVPALPKVALQGRHAWAVICLASCVCWRQSYIGLELDDND